MALIVLPHPDQLIISDLPLIINYHDPLLLFRLILNSPAIKFSRALFQLALSPHSYDFYSIRRPRQIALI